MNSSTQSSSSQSGPRLDFGIWCALAILLGAFLVFQVQPIISKMILPWFGGGPAIWTTCLLFFQLALLGGYFYAHLLSKFLKPVQQGIVHGGLLVLALLFLPITPDAAWQPADSSNPTGRILMLLLAHVGLPYILLSSTAPLLQSWFAAKYPKRSAFRLYALSNLGSLTALLSYPLFVEPRFTTSMQGIVWSVLFATFTLVCVFMAYLLWKDRHAETPESDTPSTDEKTSAKKANAKNIDVADGEPNLMTRLGEWLLWVGLAALGTLTLLAVTNHICQDVAVIPMLWVAPLSIYLVTFIICFDQPKFYVPAVWGVLAMLSLVAAQIFMRSELAAVDEWLSWLHLNFITLHDYRKNIMVEIVLCLLAMFLICMVAHGEISRTKPSSRRLTSYYLAISTGGALGGLFVALICPRIFTNFYEFQIALVAGFLTAMLAVAASLIRNFTGEAGERFSKNVKFSVAGVGAVTLLIFSIYGGRMVFDAHAYATSEGTLTRTRNFYGVLSVKEADPVRYDEDDPYVYEGVALYHGTTLHGFQWKEEGRRRTPTTYYSYESGVGRTLTFTKSQSPEKPIRVGVVGLGTGTIATYGRENDFYHYYEINPEVKRLAEDYFYYLEDTEAEVKVTLGDARVSLLRQESQDYDVLVLDAFSSDAIPIHLITVEAFEIYEKHMAEDGVICVHVSNRHLNLFPVVAGIAEKFDYEMLYIETNINEDAADAPSDWVMLSRNKEFLDDKLLVSKSQDPYEEFEEPILWTDQYSNLVEIMDKPWDD